MFTKDRPSLPWFKEYKVLGIPKTLQPYPDRPVFDILTNTARKYKKNGIIQFNYKLTYPQVKDHAERLATALVKMGLKKGDRVATLLPTSIQFVISDYGISRAGLTQIPCSSLEPLKNLEHKFSQGGPKAIICTDTNLDIAKALAAKNKITHLIVTVLEDYSNDPPAKKKNLGVKGAVWFTDVIASTEPTLPEIPCDVEEDLELLLFTGGTTGLPKGCMLTHRNIYANALQNAWGFGKSHELTQGAISVLIGLPMFHSYGHMILHTMTLEGFNQILVPDARDTKTMIQMIKTYYPFFQMGVPTQFMNMAEEELKGIGMLGISGSAPLPPNTQKKFEEKAGGGIMEGYGLSEMSPTTHLNTSLLLRLLGGRTALRINNFFLAIPGNTAVINWFARLIGPKILGYLLCRGISLLVSMTKKKVKTGKTKEKRGTSGIPFPDVEVKLIDISTGEVLSAEDIAAGKRGEMCLNGPNRMKGYWPNPGDGIDAEGFVHTGDVVEIDQNGYFYIVDRTKDMINVSGYKVYSREVDDLLYSFEPVEHAATVGIPDPEREGSERVVVFLELKKAYRGKISEQDVLAYLKDHVAKYALPKKVILIDSMPLTEVQKLDKKKLRELAKAEPEQVGVC